MYCSLIVWFLRDFQIASCCTESNAFLKSMTATHMCVSHSLLFWDEFVRHKVVRCSTRKDHCDHNFFPELRTMELCLMIKLKISCTIVIVSSPAPLISSALILVLSADFPKSVPLPEWRKSELACGVFLVHPQMCLRPHQRKCSPFLAQDRIHVGLFPLEDHSWNSCLHALSPVRNERMGKLMLRRTNTSTNSCSLTNTLSNACKNPHTAIKDAIPAQTTDSDTDIAQ